MVGFPSEFCAYSLCRLCWKSDQFEIGGQLLFFWGRSDHILDQHGLCSSKGWWKGGGWEGCLGQQGLENNPRCSRVASSIILERNIQNNENVFCDGKCSKFRDGAGLITAVHMSFAITCLINHLRRWNKNFCIHWLQFVSIYGSLWENWNAALYIDIGINDVCSI